MYTKSCTNLFNTHGCKYISPFLSPKAQLQYYTSLQRLDVEMSKLQKSGPKCLKSWFQMSKLADNIRTHPYKYLQWIKEYLQWVCKLSVSYVLKFSRELAQLLNEIWTQWPEVSEQITCSVFRSWCQEVVQETRVLKIKY